MMKHVFNKIRDIGITPNTAKEEVKRIRLLNVFCICWIGFLILFSTVDSIYLKDPKANLICHALSTLFIVSVFILQYFEKYFFARILYILASMAVYLAFANILEPNSLMEYYLLLVPMFSCLFIDHKFTNWFFLFLSYLCFLIPVLYFDHYKGVNVNPVTNFILFFSVFVVVNYFKNLNHKNEKLLEKQRNEALLSKEKIEIQQRELENLYAFQSHFMVNLSHEIRTPLTLIKGGTNQLRKEKDELKIAIINDKIDLNTDKIKQLVDNIIDMAKMNSNKLELSKKNFHILPFAIKVSASFDSIFKQKGIHFFIEKLSIDKKLVINGDKVYLERALSNLIMNAQKYCSNGDTVTIRLSADNHIFKFQIEDTGCGIPEEDILNIFLPFYRAQNSINQAGGSGIGLSFAKEVIALHDGFIGASSVLHEGSIFTIELPCSESDNILIEEISPLDSSLQVQFKNAKILLVEDNLEMQEYLKNILNPLPVSLASNGRQGLEEIEKSQPDMIITDYMMPEMDGYEFIKEAKKNGYDGPVIVLTARMDEAAKLDFLRLGIDDYLTKPFSEEELLIRIEHSLRNNLSRRSEDLFFEADEQPEDFANTTRNFVLKHLDTFEFGVNDLAALLCMTERTLNRKLKSTTGLTPNGFIREVKLVEAKKLLESNDEISLKEITMRVGFKNTSHFSNLFEARFGKRPNG